MKMHGTPVREHIANDGEGIAQWIFRKLCNHDPMRFRSPMNRLSRNKENPIYAHGTTDSVLYPLQNGKVFMVTVRELTDAEIDAQRTALGAHYVERDKTIGAAKITKKARVNA